MSLNSITLTRWQDLPPALREAVLRLSIPPAQIEYAGTLERAIATCEAGDPAEVAGLAILKDAVPVGFVVLRRGAQRPDWAPAGAVALTSMRIDAALQGKGVGQASLAAIEAWLGQHWPSEPTLALCVDDDNAAGRRAYASAGFSEYAEAEHGRIGIVRYLSKALAVKPGAA